MVAPAKDREDPLAYSEAPPSAQARPPGANLPSLEPWRARLHEVIYGYETPAGKTFDIALLVAIVASVTAVVLESVPSIRAQYGFALRTFEWICTIGFTIEYILRLLAVRWPSRYALSFFGLVDLLAVMPTYLILFGIGSHSLLVIRALRLLRVFRVLKLVHFMGAQRMLQSAMRASVNKIIVFLGSVLTMVMIVAALMYLIEGPENGFSSIPQAMYWAIVTMTTVGYGDIAPQTVMGKFLASTVMILGYGIIAVPTGIVTVELSRTPSLTARTCVACGKEGHEPDARFCKACGSSLNRDALANPAAPSAPANVVDGSAQPEVDEGPRTA